MQNNSTAIKFNLVPNTFMLLFRQTTEILRGENDKKLCVCMCASSHGVYVGYKVKYSEFHKINSDNCIVLHMHFMHVRILTMKLSCSIDCYLGQQRMLFEISNQYSYFCVYWLVKPYDVFTTINVKMGLSLSV